MTAHVVNDDGGSTGSQTSVIIAGSRSFGSGCDDARIREYVADVIEQSGYEVDEVVSGTARGADRAGELWADSVGLPVERFPAPWDDVDHPDAVVKQRSDGSTYDARAGFRRNRQMARYADRLVAIWDGKSRGTRSMIDLGRQILGDDAVFVHEYR